MRKAHSLIYSIASTVTPKCIFVSPTFSANQLCLYGASELIQSQGLTPPRDETAATVPLNDGVGRGKDKWSNVGAAPVYLKTESTTVISKWITELAKPNRIIAL